jgi:hypothetical protein
MPSAKKVNPAFVPDFPASKGPSKKYLKKTKITVDKL